MKYLYRLYQLCIALPIGLVLTVLTALTVVVGCTLGNGHFWGYHPPRLWARCVLWLLLLPVKVDGRENIDGKESYVFVANHQGAFDIFLIYGYLNRNFKWMMKWQIGKMPLVGYACKKARHIFVDKRGASRIKATYDQARDTLKGGVSVCIFPEGARSFTGHPAKFRKGAFALADELQLPVVPLTINGSFDILPRQRRWPFVSWHPLSLTIHQPIYPVGQGHDNIQATMAQAYDSVVSAIEPRYQSFIENPDQ